jgi:hypothetical protein
VILDIFYVDVVTSDMDSITSCHKKGLQILRITEEFNQNEYESIDSQNASNAEKLRNKPFSMSRITDGFWTLEVSFCFHFLLFGLLLILERIIKPNHKFD